MSINRCAAGLAALLAVAASQPAAAQSYPAQNINFLVSFAAGGVADVLARLLALKITEKTGKTIVTENRGGAGGNLAARAVAGAAADGYTVLATTTALAISATASRNRGFQASDLKAVAVVASTPDVLAVHPSHPAKTLTEYIAGAKGKPTNFGSSGTGTTPHIATEYLLRILAKLDVTHVTFTGGAPAVAAAVGNHINLLSSSLPTAVAQINEGQLRGLGVASQNRSKAAAQVPTYAESGYPNLYSATWVGFFVPSQVPDAAVAWLNTELNWALKLPDVQQKLAGIGFDDMQTTPASATQFFNAEVEGWGKRAEAIGFTMN